MKITDLKKYLVDRKIRKYLVVLNISLVALIALCIVTTKQPAPISGLEVSATTYNTAVLNWKGSDKADGYHVYRSDDGKNYEYVGTATSETYTDSELKTGTTYTYKVNAYHGIKNSEETKDTAVAEPSLDIPKLKVRTDDGQVKLEIGKVDGATGYQIYRDGEKLADQPETVYIDEDAENDESYAYEVRAERVEDEPVYSDFSKSKKASLISIGEVSTEVKEDDIHFDWDGADEYTGYKVYSGDEEVSDSSDTEYVLEDFDPDKKYDIRILGYNDDIESPEEEIKFTISEEPLTNEEAIDAAIEWGVSIAEDNSFNYGTGERAHKNGCYFCGTNIGPVKNNKGKSKTKGHSYEKTYCCNTFVTACFAHGAGDPEIMKLCSAGNSLDMTEDSFASYGSWESVGKPSMGNLIKGDVLVGNRSIGSSTSHHMALYIGNGQIVQAKRSGWDAESITVSDLTSKRYGKFDFVMHYAGTGGGTKYVINKIDDSKEDAKSSDGNGSQNDKKTAANKDADKEAE